MVDRIGGSLDGYLEGGEADVISGPGGNDSLFGYGGDHDRAEATIAGGIGIAPSSAPRVTSQSNGAAPIAGDDVFSGPESQSLVLTPLDNDQGAALTISHVAGQAISVGGTVEIAGVGTVLLNADQTLTFTPVNELDGRQTFAYTVRGADGQSDDGTIHVDLAGQSAGVGLTIAPPPPTVSAEFAVASGSAISVAALAGGGHVVSWSQNITGSGTYSVFARVYDANGVATGSQITLASSIPTPVREDGQISALPNGGFLAVYMTSQGLQARVFNAAGAAVTGAVGLTGTTTLSGVVDMTTTASGETIIVYRTGSVSYIQKISASGVLSGGASELPGLSHELVATPGGGYTLVWDGDHSTMLQIVAANGTAGEARAVVPATSSSSAGHPAFVWMPDGTGLVIHHNERSSLSSFIGQRVSPDGTPIGPQMQLGSTGNALFASPSVIPLADGGFFLVWENATVGQPRAVVGQRYDALGNAVGERVLLRLDTTNALASGQSVVMDASGTVIVTYSEDSQVFRRMLDFPSTASGDEDATIPLVIQMTQVNQDELGQVVISGLPEGATLSAGVRREDGSWLLDRNELVGLTLTAPDFAGVLQLQVTAFTDGDIANGVTRAFGVTFRPLADTPRLQNDALTTFEDLVVILNPLANDREVDGESMTITHINGTAIAVGQTVQLAGVGALKLNADGTLTFTPVAHWSGDSSFTYTVRDASGASSTATATLEVASVTDGATFSYGQLANWTPVAIDAADVRVNSTTAGVQSQSSVTALEDGGYLITWVSAGQDGSGLGVYAQRYDRMGQKVGAEHQVNDLSAGDQQHTAVLAMEDGGWVIAWSGPVAGGSTTGVYARRYDADGVATQTHLVTDASFNSQFYSGTAYNQGAPTLTAWGDGGFAIGWTTFFSGTDNDTWIRQYGADGTMLGDHWIESDSSLEDHPQLATGADGVVFAIYQDTSGFYNGPTSGQDQDYGIWIERHGLNGGLSNPIQLNTTIVGNQTHPTLAVLANGNIAAAWQTPDASGTGVVFRLLDPEGAPIMGERWANRTTAGNQSSPDIVALADGTFLILWTSVGTDGSGAGVYGQRISADGSQYLGAEFRLNATTAGDQLSDGAITDTSFAVLEDGTLVATWWGDGEVHHRRFDPPEAAFTAYQGEQIAIPLTVTLIDASETFELAISNLPPGAILSAGTQRADGAWVITPAEAASLTLTPPPGYAGDMLLRIEITTVDGESRSTAISYRPVQVLPVDNDADGAAVGFRTGADPFTDEDVPVTEVIGGMYRDAGIAGLTGGGHVVVWSGQFGDSDGWGVRAKVYGADGSVVSVNEWGSWGGDFTVNTFTTGVQQNPTVLALGDGGFAVFWHSFEQDGSQVGVYGQRFNATGLKVGVEFRVNTTTALAQEAPAATLLSDGGFVVLFEHEPVDGAGFELRGQRFDASGATVGGEFLVRNMTGGSQRWPDVTALEDGGFVAVWNSFATDGSGTALEMRVFDARNDATVYRLNQATLGSQTDVKVTTLADGSFIAVWTTVADQPGAVNAIHARHFEMAEDGTLVGDNEFSVFGAGAGTIGYPDVVGLPDGGYIILAQWEQSGDDSVDIYAQRYDADGRRVGTSFRVNETSYGDQLSIELYADPMVTVDANGDLLVVWTDLNNGNIYRRTFDIDPEPPFVGDAGEPIRLAIEVAARDASETIEIVLSNLPDGAVLSAGTLQADGSWLLGPADLSGLTLVAPSASAGTAFDLIVTVTTRQGADSFTTVAYHTVEVLPAPPGITLTGAEAADALSGNGGGDTLAGLAGDDVLDGLAGDDLLDGGLGSDTLNGGSGQDTAVFDGNRADYTIRQNVDRTFTVIGPDGTDTLTDVEFAQFADQTERLTGETRTGTPTADVLEGTAWGDNLSGLGGDDVLSGGAGADALIGGTGIDTADYSTAAAGMRAQLNTNASSNDGDGGTDTFSGIENLTGSAFNDILIGDNAVNDLRGGLGSDVLIGQGGNDLIHGGAGAANTVYGGLGDDWFVLEANDTVVEFAGEGTDTVEARIGVYNLGGHIERLVFTGTGDFTGAGNALDNTITGGIGNDVLRGGGGVDVLIGGSGIDTADYSSAAAGMRAQLNTGVSSNDGDGGTDAFSGIENLTGSAFDDVLIGNGAVNVLRGWLGSDVLIGQGGNDVIHGGTGAANTVYGGLGDDWFVLEANDSVVEFGGEGNDTVEARINTYVLAANVENLIFTGTGDFNATGHAGASTITAGAGDDNLRGRGGVDVLIGGGGLDTVDYTLAAAGVTARLDQMRATNDGDGASDVFASIENLTGSNLNDLLIGSGGHNVLRGGVGVDTLLGLGGDDILYGGTLGNNQMQGGLGNDRYVLDAFDTCVEFAGEGIDTVESRIGSYNMGAHIENLVHTGPGGFVGRGNTLDNHMTGGDFNDILRGWGGNDTLIGGLGRDEVQVRGARADYTVTAEGSGWRIVDSVAGRDGSTYVESIEVLRFTTGNTQQLLTYPPAGAGAPEPEAKDAGPLVLPATAGDKARDDAFVLPAEPDDQPLVLPGVEADELADAALAPPGTERGAPLFANLEAHLPFGDDWMRALDPDGGLLGGPTCRDGWMG